MATKTFNDICVEYAHQLGKGLPLTPPEMCNAVIMYLNQQVEVMNQFVQTALNAVKDLQTEIADIDLSDYVTLNTNQTINGEKTFTDTQFFTKGLTSYGGKISGKTLVASDSGSGTSLSRVEILYNQISNIKNGVIYRQTFQNKNGAIALTSDIPDIPEPTTSDNGKVIGVENGEYALVEQSGGSAPANMVTTNTEQTITRYKAFVVNNHDTVAQFADAAANYVDIYANGVAVHDRAIGLPYTKYCCYKIEMYGSSNTLQYTLKIPNNKNGTIALTSDIPDLDNYKGTMHIVQGTAGGGVAVHDTAVASPYTKYGYDKIETYGNSNTLQYTLNIPNKNGTIATLDDIGSPSDSKYFTRVIFHNTDEDTQYILFSCITDTDLSANTSYQNVVDLLNSLGATTTDTALPCTGKTISGGIVVGVYTDGTNIIVFDTDNSTEELNMSAEIKFISK